MPSTSKKETKSPLSNPCRASSRQVTSPGHPCTGKKNIEQNSAQLLWVSVKNKSTSEREPQLPASRSNYLSNHRDHSTKWLLSIGICHNHVLTKVTEELAARERKGRKLLGTLEHLQALWQVALQARIGSPQLGSAAPPRMASGNPKQLIQNEKRTLLRGGYNTETGIETRSCLTQKVPLYLPLRVWYFGCDRNH